MGILNRTPDSFFDGGRYWDLDAFYLRAEQLVGDGADLLDVGGVKAGPGPEVGEAEELDRVVPAIAALHDRFDVPLSVDTWRAGVAIEAFRAGAVVGNDISGFADPGFLPAAAGAGAAVVATHIRLGPRVPDPEPSLRRRGRRGDAIPGRPRRPGPARPASLTSGSSWTPGWTSARPPPSRRPCCGLRTGWRVSAGRCCSRRPTSRSWGSSSVSTWAIELGATAAAHAIGVSLGCRIVRAHDVRAARRVCDTLAAVMEAA